MAYTFTNLKGSFTCPKIAMVQGTSLDRPYLIVGASYFFPCQYWESNLGLLHGWNLHLTTGPCCFPNYTSITTGIPPDQNSPKWRYTANTEIMHIENWIVCCIETYLIPIYHMNKCSKSDWNMYIERFCIWNMF